MMTKQTTFLRSEQLYDFCLKFYPKAYREEFGEEMKYVFMESLSDAYRAKGQLGIFSVWINILVDLERTIIIRHVENLKGKYSMKNKNANIVVNNSAKRLSIWAVVVCAILLIPLIGTIRDGGVEGVGWNWTLFDFLFFGTLLFVSGSLFELIRRKMKSLSYRLGTALSIATSVLLIWINGAVGIIGDEGGINFLYVGVLLVGLIMALVVRFRPHGMARALFTMAGVQMIIPIIALFISNPITWGAPGILGVFSLNAIFGLLFIASGLLFRQASKTGKTEPHTLGMRGVYNRKNLLK